MKELPQTAAADIQLFRDVFNASPIGIAVENLEGRPLFVNPALCRFLGFTEEELQSKHCVDFSPKEDADKDWALFQQLKAGQIDHYQLEKQYLKRDGSLVWGSLSISRIKRRSSPLVIAMVEDITDKKTAEDAVREREARLRLAAQAGKMYAYDWDVATDKVVRTEEFKNVLGSADEPPRLTREEFLARIYPDDREKFMAAVDDLSPANPNAHLTYRVARADGSVIWVEKNARAFFDSQGKMLRMIGIVADITERKRAEDAVRESGEQLHLAIQAGKMYAYEWDAKTDVLVRSPEYVNVLGATEPRTLTYPQVLEKIHPEDRAKLAAAVARHSPENPIVDVSYRVLLPGKSPIWVRSSGRAFFDRKGRMLRVVGIVADITDQKLTEESLRTGEERLRLAQKVAGIGAFERNIRTGVNTWTAEMEAMYGLSPGGFVGTREAFENLVHSDDRARVRELVERALKVGQPTSGEWRVVWPDGSVHWIAGRWQALMDESGEPSRVIGVNMDITERKRAEEALRESEEKFRNVFRDAGVGMVVVSPEGRFLAANKAFCDCLGYTEEQLLEETVESITFPEDWPAFSQKLGEILTEGRGFQWFEKRCLHKSGRIVYTESSASVIRNREGDPQYLVGHVLDITERKEAEEALVDMNRKLIAAQEQERARIARELHDDISQRLALMAVELEQVQGDLSEVSPAVRTPIAELQKQIQEVSVDIQSLSHNLHPSKLEYLGVIAGIKAWCKEFAARQRIEIDLSTDVSSALPVDIGVSLFRVLQEAVHNAVKHSGVKRIEVRLWEESGDIHLIVRDMGKGFDIGAAKRSLGLGLTSMRERVRLANGTILIESKPMGGTTIHIRVPFIFAEGFRRAVGD